MQRHLARFIDETEHREHQSFHFGAGENPETLGTRSYCNESKAGDREKWTEPDELRPLTKSGRRQAEGLVSLLENEPIGLIVSSSYARCVQTVEPLAAAQDKQVELHDDALAEGAHTAATFDLIESAGEGAALCTHGDVLGNVIGELAELGTPGADPFLMKKGCTWVLERSSGTFTRATYLPPPS